MCSLTIQLVHKDDVYRVSFQGLRANYNYNMIDVIHETYYSKDEVVPLRLSLSSITYRDLINIKTHTLSKEVCKMLTRSSVVDIHKLLVSYNVNFIDSYILDSLLDFCNNVVIYKNDKLNYCSDIYFNQYDNSYNRLKYIEQCDTSRNISLSLNMDDIHLYKCFVVFDGVIPHYISTKNHLYSNVELYSTQSLCNFFYK